MGIYHMIARLAFLLIFTLPLFQAILPQPLDIAYMRFPLTIGALNTGVTSVTAMNTDSDGGLYFAGAVKDYYLTTLSTQTLFAGYLPANGDQYQWLVSVQGTSSNAVKSISLDSTYVMLFLQDQAQFVVMRQADGTHFQTFKAEAQWIAKMGSVARLAKSQLAYIFYFSGSWCIDYDPLTTNCYAQIAGEYLVMMQYNVQNSGYLYTSYLEWSSSYQIAGCAEWGFFNQPSVWLVAVRSTNQIRPVLLELQSSDTSLLVGSQTILSTSKDYCITMIDSSNDVIFMGANLGPTCSFGSSIFLIVKNYQSLVSTVFELPGNSNSLKVSSIRAISSYKVVMAAMYSNQVFCVFTLEQASSSYQWTSSKLLHTFEDIAQTISTINCFGYVYYSSPNIWETGFAESFSSSTVNTQSVAYIWTTDPSVTLLSAMNDQSTSTTSSMPTYSEVTQMADEFSVIESAYMMTLYILGVPVQEMSKPNNFNADICLINIGSLNRYSIGSSPLYVHYITDADLLGPTSTPPLATLSFGTLCNGQCDSYRLDVQGDLMTHPFISYDAITQGAKIETNQIDHEALDGNVFEVLFRAILPNFYRTQCAYYFRAFKVELRYVKIMVTNQPTITYNIGDPMVSVQLNSFSLSRPQETNTRFSLTYQLLASNGSPIPIPQSEAITNFKKSDLSFNVYSTNFNLVGSYYLKLKAEFLDYHPGVPGSAQCIINFGNICNQNVLQNVIKPLDGYFQKAYDTIITQTLTPWTSLMETRCGKPTYQLSGSPFGMDLTVDDIQLVITLQESPQMEEMVGGIYSVSLTGEIQSGSVVVNDSVQFTVYILDTAVSFITPAVMPLIEYTVTDDHLTKALPTFANSDQNYQIVYNLVVPQEIKDIVVYHTEINQLNIFTLDNGFKGEYELVLQGRYDKPFAYFVESAFTLTIFHECTKNVITKSDVGSITHYIGMPATIFTYNSWTYTMEQCLPINYQIAMRNEELMPEFFSLKTSSTSVIIEIDRIENKYFEGTFKMALNGQTTYLNRVRSTPTENFSVIIACMPLKISTKTKTIVKFFRIGLQTPMLIAFDEFDVYPECMDPAQITYQAQSLGAQSLDTDYFSFDATSRELTFTESKKPNTLKPGLIELKCTGTVNNVSPRLKADQIVKIFVLDKYSEVEDSNVINLTPIDVSVRISSVRTVESADFKNLTKDEGSLTLRYTLIPDPAGTKFYKFENEVLTLSPRKQDSGKYVFHFVASDEIITYWQAIYIEVYGGVSHNQITAVISQISRLGVATIKFNQNIKSLADNEVLLKSLEVSVVSREGTLSSSNEVTLANITWSQSNQRLMFLTLNFSSPLKISYDTPDYLKVIFINGSFYQLRSPSFNSSIELTLRDNYTPNLALIPQQLQDSATSQAFSSVLESLQQQIDLTIAQSCTLNIFVAFTLNKIWRMIDTLQIIFILPLLNVNLMGNILFVYKFFETNTNLNMYCSKDKEENVYEQFFVFDDEQTNQGSYSLSFEKQGYQTRYLVKNQFSQISNIFIFGMVSLGIILMLKLNEMYKLSNHSIWSKLSAMFEFSYFLNILVQNSLMLLIFSFVNIAGPVEDFDPDTVSSFMLSLLIILGFSLFIFTSISIIRRVHVNEEEKLKGQFDMLFKNIPDTGFSRYLVPYFVARRLLQALIVVVLSDYQALQIAMTIILSSVYVGYLILYRSSTNALDYGLTLFNECVVVTSAYLLVPFSDAYESAIELKNEAGWFFVALISFQIILNLLIPLLKGGLYLYALIKNKIQLSRNGKSTAPLIQLRRRNLKKQAEAAILKPIKQKITKKVRVNHSVTTIHKSIPDSAPSQANDASQLNEDIFSGAFKPTSLVLEDFKPERVEPFEEIHLNDPEFEGQSKYERYQALKQAQQQTPVIIRIPLSHEIEQAQQDEHRRQRAAKLLRERDSYVDYELPPDNAVDSLKKPESTKDDILTYIDITQEKDQKPIEHRELDTRLDEIEVDEVKRREAELRKQMKPLYFSL